MREPAGFVDNRRDCAACGAEEPHACPVDSIAIDYWRAACSAELSNAQALHGLVQRVAEEARARTWDVLPIEPVPLGHSTAAHQANGRCSVCDGIELVTEIADWRKWWQRRNPSRAR